MRLLRRSFATKLLVGALALVLVLVVGITAFLLISRDRQTRGAALSNADNRAQLVRQLLERVTASQGTAAATRLATQPAIVNALQSAPEQPLPAVSGALLPGQSVVVAGGEGSIVSVVGPAGAVLSKGATLPSIRAALVAGKNGGNAAGLEYLGEGIAQPAVDAAVPVRSQAGALVGVVVYVTPLGAELENFQRVVGYPIGFIPARRSDREIRLRPTGGGTSTQQDVSTNAAVRQDLSRAGDSPVNAVYSVDGEDVAGSFVAIPGPGSSVPAAYIGVEAPLSTFVGDTRTDEATVALIAVFVLLATTIVVVVFVSRFVRRPIRRLESGVRAIADGDYTTDIPVRSQDELGRLARSVNTMRAQIQQNVEELQGSRARLDRSVERLGEVSRALTTTTAGLPALRDAVVRSAVSIAGEGTAAVLLSRHGEGLTPDAAHGVAGGPPRLEDWGVLPELLAGHPVRVDKAPPGWAAGGLLAVPAFYQEEVVGALAIISGVGHAPVEGDEQSLAVLANNAAIAMENTRLFEQERETVRRLSELDSMKSDFLATVQHELRTPLTAIMGMSDLIEMCWAAWGDAQKRDAVADIQMAAHNLYDIVETIIDFSMLEADTLGLEPRETAVAPAVADALDQVSRRYKSGLPVPVGSEVGDDVSVYADPARLRQVIGALVDNAVKFSPNGGGVRVCASPLREGWVGLTVADEGIGIPPEALPHIFESFYQVDNTATRRYGGTGMGLALVRRLVEAHGGAIEVESSPKGGTRFTMSWPSGPEHAAGEARSVAERRGEVATGT